MHGKPSTLVFAIVAVVALGSSIVTKGVGSGARGRFDQALAKMSVDCSEMAVPCDANGKATVRLTPSAPPSRAVARSPRARTTATRRL